MIPYDSTPICGNCKWFRQDKYTHDYAMCGHNREPIFDFISGWRKGYLRNIFDYRNEKGGCGPSGKFWEPKE